MRTVYRVALLFFCMEVAMAFTVWQQRPAAAAPLVPGGAEAFPATVFFPHVVHYVHLLRAGWVYGPGNGGPFHQGEAVVFLVKREHDLVAARAAAGQPWTSLRELGY